jgi:hypothetical protein
MIITPEHRKKVLDCFRFIYSQKDEVKQLNLTCKEALATLADELQTKPKELKLVYKNWVETQTDSSPTDLEACSTILQALEAE